MIEKLLLGEAKVTRRDQRKRCSCCFSCAYHFLQTDFLLQDGSHKESHKSSSSSSSKKRRESTTPKCVEIKKPDDPSESDGEDDGASTICSTP